MTKGIFHAFLLGSALIAAPIAASAQTVAELRPTGQWLINSAGLDGLAAGGGKSPCIMANQFHNGFILRLSGGGGQFLSLSLDFRQNAFTQGDTYPAVVSVDGGQSYSLMATAFSPGILLIGLREAQGLYAALQAGRSLALNVVGNTVIFSLDNIREGINRLESCYSPPSMKSQGAPRQAAAPQAIPTVPNTQVYVKREAYPEFKQPTAQDILKAEEGPEEQSMVLSARPEQGVPAMPPLSESEMAQLDLKPEDLAPYEPQPVASGGQGMTLAKIEPVQTPAAPSVPKVEAQPVSPVAVKPVAKLEAKEVADLQPKNITKPQPLAVTSPQPVQTAAITPGPSEAIDAPRTSLAHAAPTSITPQQNAPAVWEAKAGEDIRIVLARWATLAGTDLVWEADGGGKVAQDVSVDGSFEDAVAQIMADNAAAMGLRGQFAQGDRIKPVGVQQASTAPVPVAGSKDDLWRAGKGDDLKTVLQTWAAQNDVALDWQADERFALREPINERGDVTTAIEAALVQFDEEAVRPVGRLNRDPETGRLSLTIETDRAS